MVEPVATCPVAAAWRLRGLRTGAHHAPVTRRSLRSNLCRGTPITYSTCCSRWSRAGSGPCCGSCLACRTGRNASGSGTSRCSPSTPARDSYGNSIGKSKVPAGRDRRARPVDPGEVAAVPALGVVADQDRLTHGDQAADAVGPGQCGVSLDLVAAGLPAQLLSPGESPVPVGHDAFSAGAGVGSTPASAGKAVVRLLPRRVQVPVRRPRSTRSGRRDACGPARRTEPSAPRSARCRQRGP